MRVVNAAKPSDDGWHRPPRLRRVVPTAIAALQVEADFHGHLILHGAQRLEVPRCREVLDDGQGARRRDRAAMASGRPATYGAAARTRRPTARRSRSAPRP